MKLSVKDLVEASKGQLLNGIDLLQELDISTDTRSISNQNIFLPLKGANFDGHDYIKEAVSKGCKGYFTALPPSEPADIVISVEDTLEAYLSIANHVRRKIGSKIIAVTGSSGKTSVKEFIYAVLSTTFSTHKSALNHNNEVGLCQTLLAMPEYAEYAVIEMGMRGLGEIELLSKYAEPDIAVITNVGNAHIGRLGSIENIAKAKNEITSYLNDSGVLVAHDDELIKKHSKWSGRSIFYGKNYQITEITDNYTKFIYNNECFEIPVMGEYNVVNAIAAIEIGDVAGVSVENIKQGLLNYKPLGDRGKVITLENNVRLIVDCYNANPESMIASINSVINTYNGSKTVLVLGDMGELGEHEEELHRKVGRFISDKAIHSLITVGEKAQLIADTAGLNSKSFMDNAKVAEFLQNNLEEDSVVLFKGSRTMQLEKIADSLNCS